MYIANRCMFYRDMGVAALSIMLHIRHRKLMVAAVAAVSLIMYTSLLVRQIVQLHLECTSAYG